MTNLDVTTLSQAVLINGNKIEFDVPLIDSIVLQDRVLVLLDSYYFPDDDADAGRVSE